MKLTGRVLISIIVISIIDLIYGLYLGLTVEEKLVAAIILIIIPIISGIIFATRRTLQRKITIIVLFVLTIIMILLYLVVLGFTGTFNQVGGGYSYKALGIMAITFAPLIASYIYLAYMQLNEIKGKYQGRQRFLF
ncbi:MAG: hypothetical protein ACRCWM_05290 [Sarcina sp.]